MSNKSQIIEYDVKKRKSQEVIAKCSISAISSMTTCLDKKNLFLCDIGGKFKEIDLGSKSIVKNFNVVKAHHILITPNNQFMITAAFQDSLTKWCMNTNEKLHSWSSKNNKWILSLACT